MWLSKAVFTAVFTVFLLIFYAVLRGVAMLWLPGLLAVPVEVTADYFLLQTLLFTVVVLLSFVGAVSVTHSDIFTRDVGTPRVRRPGRSVLRPESREPRNR